MSTGAFGPEARWQYTRVYHAFKQSSNSQSEKDFSILNLSSSSNLSSRVSPYETQWSLQEIPTQRGYLVSGEPHRNRKKNRVEGVRITLWSRFELKPQQFLTEEVCKENACKLSQAIQSR